MNFELKQVKQARVDKEFENQLQQTFVGTDMLEQREGVVVDVELFEHLLGPESKKAVTEKNAEEQRKEIHRVCFFELKLFGFLISSLSQVQRNLRNITALWAKDLGLEEDDGVGINQYDDEVAQVSKVKNTTQDIKTHEYLKSLANLIEVERVTLECFRSQVEKNMSRTITKKLQEQDKQQKELAEAAEKYRDEQRDRKKELMQKGVPEEEAKERLLAELEMKFGSTTPEDGKVAQGEDLIGFDKYVDYQENMQYIFLMHAQRIIMLTKLVNKSYEIRNQERQKKQMRA